MVWPVVWGFLVTGAVPRTSGREIHRYKAYATQQPRRPR